MTPGALAARLALIGAAWSAARLVRSQPTHAPVAFALTLALGLDLVRLGLREVRAPVEVLRVIYIATPILSAWLTTTVMVRGCAFCASLTAIVAMSAIVARSASAGWLYEKGAFAEVALGCAVTSLAWQLAVAASRFRHLAIPTHTETVVLMLVAGDLAGLLGAWLHDDVWSAWELNRWQTALVLAAVWYGQARRRAWVMTFAPGPARGSWRSGRS